MLPASSPDRIQIAFDDDRLVDHAGLLLRAGGTGRVLGCTVKAPSTLGTFLRSFRWGRARQLDRVTRALLACAWAAGAGPGEGPLTIDIDSTLCGTYGLAKGRPATAASAAITRCSPSRPAQARC